MGQAPREVGDVTAGSAGRANLGVDRPGSAISALLPYAWHLHIVVNVPVTRLNPGLPAVGRPYGLLDGLRGRLLPVVLD